MKFATRISSMRRIAWNAVQVVLGRLGLDVHRLVGEEGARRVDPLPLGLEHVADRMLRQPVDLQVGMELAAAPRRSRCRAGHGRARSATRRRAPSARGRAPASTSSPSAPAARRLARTHGTARSPSPGGAPAAVAGTLERDDVPPVSSATAAAARACWQLSRSRGSRAPGTDTAAEPPRPPCSTSAVAPPRRRGRATPGRPRAPSRRSPRSASWSAAPGAAARRRTRGSRGSRCASSGALHLPSPRRCRAPRRTDTRVVRMRRRELGRTDAIASDAERRAPGRSPRA